MAYEKLNDNDFERLDISSQDDNQLCKHNGIFEDNSFRFLNETITDTQFINEYEKIDTLEKVYTISNKTVLNNETTFTSYEFYKNV